MFGDGYLVNKPREFLFKEVLPRQLYDDFYRFLDAGGMLFVPIVINEDKPRIYLEKMSEDADAICRVFWKHEDLKKHVNKLITSSKYEGKITGWEASPESIVKSLISAGNKLPDLKITAITSLFFSGEIRDLEVFWQDERTSVI